MNFLEQLVAEWYASQGYFVLTNVKFGKRNAGGWEGEMDVVAFQPADKMLIHLEVSTDADSWEERGKRFRKKFDSAQKHYKSTFPFEFTDPVRKIAIVGQAKSKKEFRFLENVELWLVSETIARIAREMKEKDPVKNAIPEGYPLLRAIQFAVRWI